MYRRRSFPDKRGLIHPGGCHHASDPNRTTPSKIEREGLSRVYERAQPDSQPAATTPTILAIDVVSTPN
jgi:hypothetical protein